MPAQPERTGERLPAAPGVRPEAAVDIDRLVEVAQAGDGNAREELFRRVSERIRAFIAGRFPQKLRARLDEADIGQEVALRVLKGLDKYQRGKFWGWVLAITRREINNAVRHEGCKGRDVDKTVPIATGPGEDGGSVRTPCATTPSPEEQALARERSDAIMECVRRLPNRQKQVITLRLCEGLTREETASRLGVSRMAVYVAECNAKRNVRDRLERKRKGIQP